MAERKVDPYLTAADLVVLRNLLDDIDHKSGIETARTGASSPTHIHDGAHGDRQYPEQNDEHDIAIIKNANDPQHPDFEPTVLVSYDNKDIPEVVKRLVIQPYTRIATRIVRHPTDVVFLTHILLYLFVNVPSAILLFYNFTYLHGIAHTAFTFWCTGSYTLMMHNHIHNNGVLAKSWYWLDATFPYITYPLMGHTWNSYYYHHVKHHHIEGNGPDDLSSTVRYQRDSVWHFLHYVGRFIFFVWLDLPLYFLRKNKLNLAAKAFGWEAASMAFLCFMTLKVNTKASIFTLIIPFMLLRLGLMIGNWGQHALVDELEPDSDFRSSITLIDVPSNRFCFNDGYHTAHHLNPRRHWRDQPLHFLQSKKSYAEGRALVFHNIDYLMMTFKLLQKDYMYLAKCLIPIGDEQIGMTQKEIADMLRTKTRRFTEEQIRERFGVNYVKKPRKMSWSWRTIGATIAAVVPGCLGLLMLSPAKVEAQGQQKAQ